MSIMTIPPFPAQDLAKLVLGYLAEEQLMTAYDEFLQASPYLDALRNEYDRIFMTSLKNILAEYRAVKICVETCKPFILRKKLFQCANLLEVVKFLISHIDVSRLQSPDTSSNKTRSQIVTSKSSDCEVCDSLKLESCVCKNRHIEVHTTTVQSGSNVQSQSSVETTSLSDLPGNHVTTRKKHVKVLEKDSPMSFSNSSSEQLDTSLKHSTCLYKNTLEARYTSSNMQINIKPPETMESRQKIEEFNDILKFVCNKNTHTNTSNIQQENIDGRITNAGTFQDFASGVTGGDKGNVIVPDSSTSESMNIHVPVTKESSAADANISKFFKRGTKTQILFKLGSVKDSLQHQPDEIIDVDAISDTLPSIRPKQDEQKIKILSDVKVDNESLNSNIRMPAVLQNNATSTPVLKMQTIVINGTPVYKPSTHLSSRHNFTKDEIMAMPTIIITPVSGPSQIPAHVQPQTTVPQTSNLASVNNDHTARSLEPLIINVSANDTTPFNTTSLSHQINEGGLVKTVDSANLIKNVDSNILVNTVCDSTNLKKTLDGNVAHQVISTNMDKADPNNVVKTTDIVSASVPKDNIITTSNETSTPQVVPPTRKSSSTPRRTSHVRVLDFTTPRRILHETINECILDNNSGTEVVISKSSNIIISNTEIVRDGASALSNIPSCDKNQNNTFKKGDKCVKNIKSKKNWDADLRALVGSSNIKSSSSSRKPKPKTSKKKNQEDQLKSDDLEKKKTCKKKTLKNKKQQCSEELKEDISTIQERVDIPVKPTINIISGSDWGTLNHEADKNQNKSNHDVFDNKEDKRVNEGHKTIIEYKCNSEDPKLNNDKNESNNDEHDTPEVDRLSLQNVMGARLNISDLLETPYKQALYEIQMDTPKFLGPDIPDEPMSDIKIMNIPTPRFLNSSKGTQATPSSYSSRPTDYSSSGSYYKPDDQDYIPEHFECDIAQENPNVVSPSNIDNEPNENRTRSSRPVRKCTKNVSYYNSPNVGSKAKDENIKGNDTKTEDDSSSNDFVILLDKKTNKENIVKNKDSTPKPKIKSEKGKKPSSKKYKSPIKKEVSKSFMKIRPRRSTPTKSDKIKKKTSEVKSVRKRTTSKEKNIHPMPAVAVAPTKSRRKSSTPRKLHCTKIFNSESSGHNSPEPISKNKQHITEELDVLCTQDSDTEQLKLRWSDDGSQDTKSKEMQNCTPNESEDITKIQEYIQTTKSNKDVYNESEGSLHIDLIKRGFDIETAKIIERDLLDTPPYTKQDSNNVVIPKNVVTQESLLEKTVDSEASTSNLQIVQDELEEEEIDEVELSVYECNEESRNYLSFHYDESTNIAMKESQKLKDKFSMEVCIDDGVSIRLRATPLSLLFEQDPQVNEQYDQRSQEIALAVKSITDKSYTPCKETIKAQCFEIFDSTLTSIDTPLKVTSPKLVDTKLTVTEIVLEVEKCDVKEKPEPKKRKRFQSGNASDESVNENKRAKPEAQYLLNSANIQNIDIESVLSKLHGP